MEWISVKDKLPENNNYVLVADFNFTPTEGLEADNYFIGYWDGENWFADANETFVRVCAGWNGGIISSDVNQQDVTHWMPLPEPPKQ